MENVNLQNGEGVVFVNNSEINEIQITSSDITLIQALTESIFTSLSGPSIVKIQDLINPFNDVSHGNNIIKNVENINVIIFSGEILKIFDFESAETGGRTEKLVLQRFIPDNVIQDLKDLALFKKVILFFFIPLVIFSIIILLLIFSRKKRRK